MKSLFRLFFILLLQSPVAFSHDYRDALSKSILFLEGQRSGFLPANQRMKWRENSALKDGSDYKVDLTGGYYDAGDNVKFGFPMAFSITMLGWSVVEFGDVMPPSEKKNAFDSLKWGTDYLLKTVSDPNRIFVQVGDPVSDHNCWQRPEDMTTPRNAYVITAPNPASDIAAETAAAFAAGSIAFMKSDSLYAQKLLVNAIRLFDYADSHRGSYSDDPDVKKAACPNYCSYNGYKDELLWGAAWLRRATRNQKYLNYLVQNHDSFGAGNTIDQFNWDSKYGGLNVLVSQEALQSNNSPLEAYRVSAEKFMCMLAEGSGIDYSPGGLIYRPGMCNLQNAAALSFLMVSYADSLVKSKRSMACGSKSVAPDVLLRAAKKQVDYILGDNPKKISYMVGYGTKFPQHVHHRASALPSKADHPQPIACKAGTPWYISKNPNPNLLVGAVVGGPGKDDAFADDRNNAGQSEPTTYINAPIVGSLAYFAANPNFQMITNNLT